MVRIGRQPQCHSLGHGLRLRVVRPVAKVKIGYAGPRSQKLSILDASSMTAALGFRLRWRCVGRCPLVVGPGMSANCPYALWRQVAALLRDAARLAGDQRAVWPVRGRAARLCRALALEVAPDEALCSDVMRAAQACTEPFAVVHNLLLAAFELAPDPARLIVPTHRLCRQAHEAHHHDTVVVALVTMLDIGDFDGDVPAAWLVSACSVSGEPDYWLRRLVRRWVELFGARHEGIRAVVRDRADVWFPTRRFRLDVLRAMHAAEPTAAGWVVLARRRSETEGGALGLSFGERHADAVAALREALARKEDPGAHTALEGWLAELSQC